MLNSKCEIAKHKYFNERPLSWYVWPPQSYKRRVDIINQCQFTDSSSGDEKYCRSRWPFLWNWAARCSSDKWQNPDVISLCKQLAYISGLNDTVGFDIDETLTENTSELLGFFPQHFFLPDRGASDVIAFKIKQLQKKKPLAFFGDKPKINGVACFQTKTPFIYVNQDENKPWNKEEIYKNIACQAVSRTVHSLYVERFAFPAHAITGSYHFLSSVEPIFPSFKEWKQLYPSCTKVQNFSPETYRQMILDVFFVREPVNIAMSKWYKIQGTNEFFSQVLQILNPGSLFHQHYENQKKEGTFLSGYDLWSRELKQNGMNALPPNISIFCKTPLFPQGPSAEAHQWDPAKLMDCTVPESAKKVGCETVNVINIIGLAFDHQAQSDYKYFSAYPKTVSDELLNHARIIWGHVLNVCRQKAFKEVVYAGVGCGAFAVFLPLDIETTKLWLSREQVDKTESMQGHPAAKALYFRTMFEVFEDSGITLTPLGQIPDSYLGKSKELEKTLICNAWDPHSMVGNGNWNDRSLDGFFGRCTYMAPLCWPVSNLDLGQKILEKVAS